MKYNTIKTSNYEGWAVSIGTHLILTLIFLFVVFDKPIEISEYSMVTFSNYNPRNQPVLKESPTPNNPPVIKESPAPVAEMPKIPAARATAKTVKPASRKVDVAKRRMIEQDINRIPVESTEKVAGTSNRQKSTIDRRGTLHGVNENLSSLDDELLNTVKPGGVPSDKSVGEKVDAIATPGTKGSDVKFDKPYDVQWQGIKRGILYDPMPSYPSGLDKEARIKIRITILPDGTVGDVIPVQKGDAMLESISMKTLKLWRLSRLEPNVPQTNQTAVVTFRFVLE